ncbi:uncharacterized protein LOC129593159 isoform X2 [Paramacrobiotus metropolitanus]|uniref:uncharacterized protein LOC129593159 isoform X2 n=1 Tax=Paramacrobiotus metropolitanus TaxID=2943436 RepID=UPI002445F9AB|nr:uncharacterized protein LOC129593159 isoform X2 [Paramacrobiotus metropolitanus]
MFVKQLHVSSAFLLCVALALHYPAVCSETRASPEPVLSHECFNRTELLASCDMGTKAQPDNSSAVIAACSQQPETTWYRRYDGANGPFHESTRFQFDLVAEIGSFNESVIAVSRCTPNPDWSPTVRFDAALTTAKIYQEPDDSVIISFWYRKSYGPSNITEFYDIFCHVNYYNIQGDITDITSIWSNTYSIAPDEWHYVERKILDNGLSNPHWEHPDLVSPFISFTFITRHSGGCRPDQIGAKAIALDDIQIFAAHQCTSTALTTTIVTTTADTVNSVTSSVDHHTASSNIVTAAADISSSTTIGTSATLSPFSVELQMVTNKTAYPDNLTYYTQSPHNVLSVIQNAVGNNPIQLTFSDVLVIANFFEEFALTDTPPKLPEGAQQDAVNTLLQIVGLVVNAEESGKLDAPVTSSEGYGAAAAIYQALENMFHNLPPNDEPYVFNHNSSVAYVYAVLINSSSQFEHFNFTTKLEIKVFDPETRIIAIADDSSVSVAGVAFNTEALREAFIEIKQTAHTTPVKFAFSLSAVLSFKFATFIPTNELRERSSPIVLLASLAQGTSLEKQDMITLRHNVDKLFSYPSGARRYHRCTYLNYTSKQWSEDGCRMTTKHVKWNSTTVECTCDHLTPFSLLLTLCGSLSKSFVPKDKPLTFDLAIVTTATTSVAAVCCLLALIIVVGKIWRGRVLYNEVTFTRMGLWMALFGMYLFTIFSQLMVHAPQLCGQKFCLASGILVHWFTLMSVAWTVVQTVDVMQIILDPVQRWKNRHRGFRVTTWLAATFIPGMFPFLASMPHFFSDETIISSLGGYGYGDHEKWCWLNDEQTWIPWVTFIVPLTVAGVLNVAAVVLYIRDEMAKKRRQKRLAVSADIKVDSGDLIKHKVYGVIINTSLMGLIWLSVWLALFSCFFTDPTPQYVVVLLLTVACGSQAVYVIVFQGILGDKSSKSASSINISGQTYASSEL